MSFKIPCAVTTALSEGTWRVSSDNIFVQEYHRNKIYISSTPKTRPNWPLIIPLAILLIAAIAVLSVFLYRRWRKNNCFPIYFAGSVLYIQKGDTLRHANDQHSTASDVLYVRKGYMPFLHTNDQSSIIQEDWLSHKINSLKAQGLRVDGLFTDPHLTIPFDPQKPISAPVHLYPKITK